MSSFPDATAAMSSLQREAVAPIAEVALEVAAGQMYLYSAVQI